MPTRGRQEKPKIAIACQGGGMHAAFTAGVLTAILEHPKYDQDFELAALSGTSAGALCTLMVWYGLADKNGQTGSAGAAVKKLKQFVDLFTARTPSEKLTERWASLMIQARDTEVPVLGLMPPALMANPRGALMHGLFAALPRFGLRRPYCDVETLLHDLCPDFDAIDWDGLKTRLLVGASEVKNGVETVFDSHLNAGTTFNPKHIHPYHWRKLRPLSLAAVDASGALPTLRDTKRVDGLSYWDGLYSQNPPVRELVTCIKKDDMPDEIWVVRINPQQCERVPTTMAEIDDRQNELMGNLSLNKELDFISQRNLWLQLPGVKSALGANYHPVAIRTIKMERDTAMGLSFASKFDRSEEFVDRLQREGRRQAEDFLGKWPHHVGEYPKDVGYWDPPP